MSTKTRNRAALWALTATHTANDFYTGAVAALLPFFVLNAQYSYAAVAGITLAATALSSIAQPVFGYVSDRFGLRWLPLAGLLAAGAGIALSGLFADSYVVVLIVVAISGLGVAAYHPTATVQARELGGGTSGAMSLFSVGGNVGVALAPSGVILVVGLFGLQGTVWLMIPAVVFAVVYIAVSGKSLLAGSAGGVVPVSAAARPHDDWRSFAWLTAVLAMWSVAYVGTSTFVSLYSIERFNASTSFAAIALSVFPAAGAVGTLIGGFLADRFGRLLVIRSGYVLAALSVLGIIAAPNAGVVIVATAALGLSLFLPFSAQITLSHSYLPGRIGVASGVTLGLTLSLGGLFSPLLGQFADAAGIQPVFMIMAALLLVGLSVSFVLRDPGVKAPADAAELELEEVHD